MPSFKRPIGASGVALAMALVAAACSSGSTDTTATGASDTAATPTETTDAAPAASSEPTESDEEAGEQAEAEPEETAESEGPAPAIEHSFPDLETVTISDGATVNLADELAGGDTPILLWFFAPH